MAQLRNRPVPARAEKIAKAAAGRVKSAGPLRRVLAGVGAFAVTAGLLLRFYAAPALIVIPANYYGTQVLADPHATYFDQDKQVMRANAPLSYVHTIRGDPSAATGTTVTWDSYAYLWNPKTHEQLLDSYQRAVINRRTGELQDCCGAAIDDDPRVRQYGLADIFPVGTRPVTYQMFDVNTERTWPAVFRGTAVVRGVRTDEFTLHIPATTVQKVPGISMSLLGVPGATYTVTANRTYAADVTYWIDPRTGSPINLEEKISSQLHDPADIGSLTLASADLKMTASTQASLAAYSGRLADEITLVGLAGPLTGVIAGVLLLLAAVVRWPSRKHTG